MKTSLNWLNDHLDLSGKSTDELSDLLTFAGIEVEGIEHTGVDIENVVVAEVLSSDKHPDADKLSVVMIDDGSGPDTPRQIVCGAKNYRVGDKVPVALPGARLPGGMKIKKGKLRGVESHGMLCAPGELGAIGNDGGLWILPADLAPGTPISEITAKDTVFDLEITPNRSDLLSHLGIARELAALTKLPLKTPPARYSETPTSAAPADTVRIESPTCPLYTARRITGVKIGASPDWLQKKLQSIGLRPINNIVDITNFVLMEMGQPLHAFDAAKLSGGIVVRPAADGEKFLALDGETYTLETSDLVIADHQKPVAIAGVMGGDDTGVTETTTDVLLESAYFTPSEIRRTSRRLILSSDSSYRFERGVDPAQVTGASDLATKLILELAGGTAGPELFTAGESPQLAQTVQLDINHVHRLLGAEIPAGEINSILSALGFENTSDGWASPTYRLDVSRPVDLIEEVARVVGLDRIPSTTSGPAAEFSAADQLYSSGRNLKLTLAARGFYEAQTIKLISDTQIADALLLDSASTPIRVSLPLSDDHTTLRPSLLPGLLTVAARNVRQGASTIRFIESGTVFSGGTNTEESQHLALLVAGDAIPSSWAEKSDRSIDVFDLTGVLASIGSLSIQPTDDPAFLLSADLTIADKKIGRLVQLHPARARELDLDTAVVAAELDLDKLRTTTSQQPRFQELPKFPAITRDVAMELPLDLPNADLAAFFADAQQAEPLLQSAHPFDLFVDSSGEKISPDRKSLAYNLVYRDATRTLKTEEVDAAHERILGSLTNSFPAQIR